MGPGPAASHISTAGSQLRLPSSSSTGHAREDTLQLFTVANQLRQKFSAPAAVHTVRQVGSSGRPSVAQALHRSSPNTNRPRRRCWRRTHGMPKLPATCWVDVGGRQTGLDHQPHGVCSPTIAAPRRSSATGTRLPSGAPLRRVADEHHLRRQARAPRSSWRSGQAATRAIKLMPGRPRHPAPTRRWRRSGERRGRPEGRSRFGTPDRALDPTAGSCTRPSPAGSGTGGTLTAARTDSATSSRIRSR